METFEDRAVVATALVQMADLYEKLGDDQFRDVYKQVLRDYPDQAEAVAAAQTRLEPPAPSPTMTVRELMRSGGQAQRRVSSPTNNPFFAVSGDGQTFVYTDRGDLVVRNMATGEARHMYGIDRTSDEFFASPVLSRDEKTIAFMRFPMSGDGTTRLEVDSVGGGHRDMLFDFGELGDFETRDWSPDGANVLIVGQAADRSRFLATVSLEDKASRRLVTLDWGAPVRAEYSPDGRFIAYDSTKGGDSKIYLMSADGAEERVLVDSSGEDDSPLWTRDGRFLLFRSDRSGKWDLYALRMQHGEPAGQEVVVKSNLGAATYLRGVTTEGQLVYFEAVGGFDIAIAERIDGTATTLHASILPKVQTIENKNPGFAPDGRRLAYLAGAPGSKVTIRVTDMEGRILTDIPLDRRISTNDIPRFSPDGTMMAMRVYDAGEPRLMVLSADRGTVLKVFSPLEEKGYAVVRGWSRDSRYLYAFVKMEAGERSLATIDVDTEQVVDSTVLPDTIGNAELSPSGTHLAMALGAFSPGPGLSTQLVLRSLEDGSERLLTEEGSSFGGLFVWDSDSRHLMYRKSGDPRLYSFSLDTEEETVLVEDMENLNLTAVSPDGRYWALEVRGQRDTLILALENFLPEELASPKGNEQGARR